jgi:hypothetical protein
MRFSGELELHDGIGRPESVGEFLQYRQILRPHPALRFNRTSPSASRPHSSARRSAGVIEWRAGEFDADELALTGPSWQYIHIQVPDFMVKAIWPDWPEGDAEPADPRLEAPSYSTPYLHLMQDAIRHFGLTELHQEKKDVLSDWFRTQKIDGEPVSKNLADAMATLIRLPSAQRGGAKRMLGPDLRYNGQHR